MTRLSFIVIASILLSWSPPVAADALHDRFRDEATRDWKALRDFTMGLQGTASDVGEPVVGYPESIREQAIHTFKGDRGQLLHRWEHRAGERKVDDLRGINPDYSFRIERLDATGPWIIDAMEKDSERIRSKIEGFGSIFFVGHSLDGQDLAWTASQRGFKVNSLTPVMKDGRDLAWLDFSSITFKRQDYQIRGGRILLDPNRRWSILEFDLQLMLDIPCTLTGRVEYGEDIEGFPIPRHYVYDFKAKHPQTGVPLHRRRTCDYQMTRGHVADSEFRLPAYGLPEPGKPTPQGWPLWAWLVVGAVVCMGGAELLRRRARARSAIA